MRRSMTRMRACALAAAVMAVTVGGSCTPSATETKVSPKKSGEPEAEVEGTIPPTRLGGPLEAVGMPVTFSPRKLAKLNVDIQQLNEHELVGYLNTLVYDMDAMNDEIDSVACVHATPAGDTPCAPTEGARVFIEPEIGAHLWKHGDYAASPHGVVVARILNYETDDRREATFGFPAHTKVWWLVDLDPATQQPRSRFFRRTYAANAPFIVQVGSDQPFFYCDHVHKVHHGNAIAKYVSCSQSLTMQPDADPERAGLAPAGGIFRQAAFTHAIPLPKRPTVMALTATWITCDMGCCSTTR